ncbi:hypothetical protein L5515_015555 [Caenorhabditis briggsae]|uniref:Homeobox domain-containing protein n=1 Tax=Caenorhabditis briggsae TaxID=6238 RepID=A0AAE9EF40_CAEBR|nr:hypothetical protein L5515_015555 [Caenorhabditis briggsae]
MDSELTNPVMENRGGSSKSSLNPSNFSSTSSESNRSEKQSEPRKPFSMWSVTSLLENPTSSSSFPFMMPIHTVPVGVFLKANTILKNATSKFHPFHPAYNFDQSFSLSPAAAPPPAIPTLRKVSKLSRMLNPRFYSTTQTEILEAKYNEYPYVTSKDRSDMEKNTGLTWKQIKNWFQHRRYMQRKKMLNDVKGAKDTDYSTGQ